MVGDSEIGRRIPGLWTKNGVHGNWPHIAAVGNFNTGPRAVERLLPWWVQFFPIYFGVEVA